MRHMRDLSAITDVSVVDARRKSYSFCRAVLCISAACRHTVSVCLSVTFANCVKTNKHIIRILSPSGRSVILVFP